MALFAQAGNGPSRHGSGGSLDLRPDPRAQRPALGRTPHHRLVRTVLSPATRRGRRTPAVYSGRALTVAGSNLGGASKCACGGGGRGSVSFWRSRSGRASALLAAIAASP